MFRKTSAHILIPCGSILHIFRLFGGKDAHIQIIRALILIPHCILVHIFGLIPRPAKRQLTETGQIPVNCAIRQLTDIPVDGSVN